MAEEFLPTTPATQLSVEVRAWGRRHWWQFWRPRIHPITNYIAPPEGRRG